MNDVDLNKLFHNLVESRVIVIIRYHFKENLFQRNFNGRLILIAFMCYINGWVIKLNYIS